MTVFLRYDIATPGVTVEYAQSLPADTADAVYYQLGRVIDSGGTLSAVQDHMAGIPQMWWIFQCQQ